MSTQVWMVRAGKDAIYVEEFFSKNIVAIGWGVIGDLKHVHGRDQIGLLLQKHFPEYNKHQLSASAGQIHRFREELVPGEIVLTYDPDTRLYRCGKIEGDYQYKPELPEELQHTRPVSWNGSVRRDDLTPESKNSLGAISTIFCISKVAGEEIVSLVKAGIPDQTEGPVPSEVVQEEEAEVRENTEQRALEFLQDRMAVLAIVPNRHEIEFHLWILFSHFEPTAALQFCLAIGAPRRPKMNHCQVGRFDCFENLLFSRFRDQSSIKVILSESRNESSHAKTGYEQRS